MTWRKFTFILVILLLSCTCGCLSLPGNTEPFISEDEMATGGWGHSSSLPMEEEAYETAEAGYLDADDGFSPDQQIIKTASIGLDIMDIEGSIAEISRISASYGGFVSSSNLQKDTGGTISASVVIRVRADQFDQALEALRGLGTVRWQTMNADDVTEEYIDLEARLHALNTQKEQYERIMDKAEEIEDILRIQVEIERVQVQIEQITGRIRYLENRVDLATISVSLHEPVPVGKDMEHDFVEVLNAGLRGFLLTIDAIIVVFLSLLPLILLGGGIYGIYRWRKRSRDTNGKDEKEGDSS